MFAPDTKLVLSMRRRTFVRADFLWAFTFWRGIASKFAIYEGNVLGLVGSKQYFWDACRLQGESVDKKLPISYLGKR